MKVDTIQRTMNQINKEKKLRPEETSDTNQNKSDWIHESYDSSIRESIQNAQEKGRKMAEIFHDMIQNILNRI